MSNNTRPTEGSDNIKSDTSKYDYGSFKYIYPPNSREQEQLDIMMKDEYVGKDPLDPKYIENDIAFETDFWSVSWNKFPYDGAKKQFLIVIKQPVYDMADLSPEMWLDLQGVLAKLKNDFGVIGGAFCMRYGDPALSGASLKRLHAHAILPDDGCKVSFKVGGKSRLKEHLVIKKPEELDQD